MPDQVSGQAAGVLPEPAPAGGLPGSVTGIGYQGQDMPGFLAAVSAAGIEIMYDVRLNPVSRKKGFSKNAIARALAGIGVAYRHEPALGNPKSNRAGFSGSGEERAEARRRYTELLSAPAAQEALTRIAETASGARAGLLCYEKEEQHCHRDVILNRLARPSGPGIPVESRGPAAGQEAPESRPAAAGSGQQARALRQGETRERSGRAAARERPVSRD